MTVRLSINGDSYELTGESITLGTDPSCVVTLQPSKGLCPRHAVIRQIAGRWIIEAREADGIRVGDGPPTRLHWLKQGDVIRLTDDGPDLTYEPDFANCPPASSQASLKPEPKPEPKLQSKPVPTPDLPLPSDTFQLSPPRPLAPLAIPPLHDPIELDDLKLRKEPEPVKVRATFAPANDDEAIPLAPRQVPLPRISSWSDPSEQVRNPRVRFERGFWVRIVVAGIAVVVVAAVWLSSGGMNSPADPQTISNTTTPSQSNSTTSTEQPPSIATRPVESVSPSTTATRPPASTSLDPAVMTRPSNPATSTVTPSTPATPANPPTTSAAAGPSAIVVEVRDGIYGVFARDAGQKHCYRIGSAWAVSRRNLVTSGAVAIAVEELKREGLTIVVCQNSEKKPISIQGTRIHAAYKQAVERAKSAKAQLAAVEAGTAPRAKPDDESEVPPEVELSRALTMQARFDLAVLDIVPGERLWHPLPFAADELPDPSKLEMTLIGYPFDPKSFKVDAIQLSEQPAERRSRKSAATGRRPESTLTLMLSFPDDVADINWSGSPVFDRSRRVIGVYSRPSIEDRPSNSGNLQKHSVVWLGRLREFAPEIE